MVYDAVRNTFSSQTLQIGPPTLEKQDQELQRDGDNRSGRAGGDNEIFNSFWIVNEVLKRMNAADVRPSIAYVTAGGDGAVALDHHLVDDSNALVHGGVREFTNLLRNAALEILLSPK